jgi:hypothetical protein
MEVLTRSENTVVERLIKIQHPTEGVMIYVELVDGDSKKVLDYSLRSKDGHHIDEPELVAEVLEFIDKVIGE